MFVDPFVDPTNAEITLVRKPSEEQRQIISE